MDEQHPDRKYGFPGIAYPFLAAGGGFTQDMMMAGTMVPAQGVTEDRAPGTLFSLSRLISCKCVNTC